MTEYSKQEIEEIDRNARAFGWEIGRGTKPIGGLLMASDDNPFLDPDWRDNRMQEVSREPYVKGSHDCCCGNPECNDFEERMAKMGIPLNEITTVKGVVPLTKKQGQIES